MKTVRTLRHRSEIGVRHGSTGDSNPPARSSGGLLSSAIWLLVLYFCLPGLMLACMVTGGLLSAGWHLFNLPAWATSVYLAAAWISIFGTVLFQRGDRLPRGFVLKAGCGRVGGWNRLIVLALPVFDAIGFGFYDTANGPFGGPFAACLPALAWGLVVACPVGLAGLVLSEIVSNLQDQLAVGTSPSFASRTPCPDARVQHHEIEEDWDQRFARQRAARDKARAAQGNG